VSEPSEVAVRVSRPVSADSAVDTHAYDPLPLVQQNIHGSRDADNAFAKTGR
jgi:hypothetical protein